MLSDSDFDRLLRREVERLPLPPAAEWTPKRGRTASLTPAILVGAVTLIAIALAGGNALREWREQPTPGSSAASASASPRPTETPATSTRNVTPSASASVTSGPTGSPRCPAGQLPELDIAQPAPPGDQPGTGAASAEAAFQQRYPNVSGFAMYAWGADQPARRTEELGRGPVWIIAGSETFIAQLLGSPGGNNWFVYPARFIGCRAA